MTHRSNYWYFRRQNQGGPVVPTTWILANNFWLDQGIWNDLATWND